MVIQIGFEVWVNEINRATIGKIVEVKSEFVVLETIQGRRVVADREKVRPLSELYHV